MKSFSDRDVRRHYDLLQHNLELGLTELKAMDGDQIIGLGFFDNEDDFVSECKRYSQLGELYVGINPRSHRLMDNLGGLKNRMRTMFMDVAGDSDISYVTGVVGLNVSKLVKTSRRFLSDVSVFFNQEVFYPMDYPILVSSDNREFITQQMAKWIYGKRDSKLVSLIQFVRVMGTGFIGKKWYHSRVKFRKYRPYLIDGIASEIFGEV